MTWVRLEPAAPRFRVKRSTTEPLRNLVSLVSLSYNVMDWVWMWHFPIKLTCFKTMPATVFAILGKSTVL